MNRTILINKIERISYKTKQREQYQRATLSVKEAQNKAQNITLEKKIFQHINRHEMKDLSRTRVYM